MPIEKKHWKIKREREWEKINKIKMKNKPYIIINTLSITGRVEVLWKWMRFSINGRMLEACGACQSPTPPSELILKIPSSRENKQNKLIYI